MVMLQSLPELQTLEATAGNLAARPLAGMVQQMLLSGNLPSSLGNDKDRRAGLLLAKQLFA